MAYSDVMDKLGQIKMTNMNLIAQRMDPTKTPETDLSGFQEQGGYIDQETIDQLEQYDKDKQTKPVDTKGKKNFRKDLYPPYKGTRKFPQTKGNNRFKGMTDDQIKEVIAKEDAERFRKAEEERLDQDPELNKQREDMRQGDYLEDPENPFDLNTLLQIGGAVGGILPFMGGNMLRYLFGPRAMASTPQDGPTPTRLFYNAPYANPKMFIKDKQTIDDAKERFKWNTGINLAKYPHTPRGEKITLPNGKMIDSPLRFRTDAQREQDMNDLFRGFKYDGT